MKGSESKLVAYMQGPTKRFVIPVYQRNYDWKIENCKQLFDDLIKLVRNERKSHFFGSMVSVFNPDGMNEEYLIIDGQQRLTTISLLLLVIYNLIEKNEIASSDATLSKHIYEQFLVDIYQKDEERIKLKSVKQDSLAFQRLFNNKEDYLHGSNLTINYNYFKERILKQDMSVNELFDAICKLEVINIMLNQDDNPQLIFESLNSTGVALSEGDKIRNFILMGQPAKEQGIYYENYWHKIELCTNYDVSSFIRDYLSIKQQAIPPQTRVYQEFKSYVEGGGFHIEDLLRDLLDYSKRYEVLLKGNTQSKELNAIIYRLNRLETTVTRPFFLEVLRLYSEDKLTQTELTEIFTITESYLFRRLMCDLPTNSLNKIFLMLHREVMRFDGSDSEYLDKLKYAILTKKDRVRFPRDDEFSQSLAERQVYSMNSKNKIYILERIENYGILEDKDIYRHFDDGTYSIEHIMPQQLTPAWIQDLGDDYERIHETWLHRLANLTLTAYNSKYSNSSFFDKKNMKHGFRDSGIKMNTFIAQKDKWTEVELEERSLHLMTRSLEIWSMAHSEYKPTEKIMDYNTLEDDVDLKGRQISKFSYKNIEQPVTNWIDMYERVLKILHAEDKSILAQLANENPVDSELAVYFSYDQKKLRAHMEIDNGIYAEKNTSTWTKISILRRLFNLHQIEPADLIFYLKDEESGEDRENEEERHRIRRKYWNFALPFIQKANDNKMFSNAKTSKSNWISGFFGVAGANISCVANFDEARVDFNLENPDSSVNKKHFDLLFANKEEIEEEMGLELEWDRGDEKKSSKIYIRKENIGIGTEADWQRLTHFHAEWSKMFYEVIVPYLME